MCIFSRSLLIPTSRECTPSKTSKQRKRRSSIPEANENVLLSLFQSYGIFPRTFSVARALSYSGATLGIGAVTGTGVPLAATGAGFTANGIAAGSIAAAWQSSIGSVAAGSSFASLQALGATGGFALLGPISLIAGAIGLTIGGGAFIGVGVHKHIKEIKNFAKNTKLILPHV